VAKTSGYMANAELISETYGLPTQMEQQSYAVFWVKVPYIPASPNTKTIYIYYGKSDATTTSNPENTLEFYDDFETDLSKWELLNNGTRITRSSDRKAEGNYSVRINDNSGSLNVGIRRDITERSMVIEHYMNLDTDSTVYIFVNFYNSHKRLHVRYDSGSNALQYYDGAWHSISSISLDTWYKVRWVINLDTGKFDCYVNGQLKVSNANLYSVTVSETCFQIAYDAATTGISYWDLVWIRKYVDPEPSHGDWGAEESLG